MTKKSTPTKNSTKSTASAVTVDLHGIPVLVTYKRIRTLRLRVTRDGSVHLSVPIGISDKRAMLFLSSREDWIRDSLHAVSAARAYEEQRADSLMLWGIRYPLTVREGGNAYRLTLPESEGGAIVFSVPRNSTETQRTAHLDALLKEALESYLAVAFPKWEALTGLHAHSRDIRSMKSRWGSCNTRTAHIRMNLRLVHHEKICTDYVILHELCHLRHPNHGKDFKALLARFMPEWQSVKALLNRPEAP
jgi:predicted metal-dependent hydrolase